MIFLHKIATFFRVSLAGSIGARNTLMVLLAIAIVPLKPTFQDTVLTVQYISSYIIAHKVLMILRLVRTIALVFAGII